MSNLGSSASNAIPSPQQMGMSFDPNASERYIKAIDDYLNGLITESQMFADMTPIRSPQLMSIPVT